MKAALLAAVEATPDDQIDSPGPESMREYAPTVGVVLMLLGTHWLMHAGQVRADSPQTPLEYCRNCFLCNQLRFLEIGLTSETGNRYTTDPFQTPRVGGFPHAC